MSKYNNIFKRTEKKYRISENQKDKLLKAIGDKLIPDKYGESTVGNIYFDTDDHRLIRASIEKPTLYKEKLRLRCYGKVSDESNCFVELKKKYKGIVYKRRVNMKYRDAVSWLCHGILPQEETQIIKEINSFIAFYGSLKPMAVIFYDRTAYFFKEDPTLRITFDSNIRYKKDDTDLRSSEGGKVILEKNEYIMEIKSPTAMPLWLTKELDQLKIYPSSYSKYGTAYTLDFQHKI